MSGSARTWNDADKKFNLPVNDKRNLDFSFPCDVLIESDWSDLNLKKMARRATSSAARLQSAAQTVKTCLGRQKNAP